MQHHGFSFWPLTVSGSAGPQPQEDTIEFGRAWVGRLGRGHPFASPRVFADEEALVHPPGAAQQVKQWLEAHGEVAVTHAAAWVLGAR